MKQMNKTKYYISLLTAVFIWSSAILVTKFALVGMGPLTLSLFRILVAFLVLLPFALKRGFTFQNLFTKNAMIYGIFGYGGNLALLSIGMITCSANISSIIHGLLPVFMILFGYTMLKEAITKSKVIGIALSLTGVTLASIGDLSNGSGTTIFGIILVCISILTWGFYSVFSKKTATGMDSFVLSEICFGTSFLFVLPLALIEILFTGFVLPDLGTILSTIYLGVMSGAVGIILWNYGLKKVDSAVAGIYFNLMPVIGLIIALFAGETITFLQVSGCALVLIGVLIGSKVHTVPMES